MFFSELYGAYYNTVAKILKKAIDHPVSNNEIRKIIEDNAFGESIVTILDSIYDKWQLLLDDGTTILNNEPTLPLTTLQKQWLKAISLDPRIKLFTDDDFGLDDVEPLFKMEDIIIFDKYNDGDNYNDEKYISNFRLILGAINNKYPLYIETLNRKGNLVKWNVIPNNLEYSSKDDKFRLICKDGTINLGRIVTCKRSDEEVISMETSSLSQFVTFELKDERNALDRALLHFAHLEKRVQRNDDKYIITIYYDQEDETEIVIRILSFGPMIKVIEPDSFVNLIRKRLIAQKKL